MENKEIAHEIITYVSNIPDFWSMMRDTALKQLAVVGNRAKELGKDLFESEDKFIGVIKEIIDACWNTGVFEPVDGLVIEAVLKSVLVPILRKIFGDNWFEQIKAKMSSIVVVNGRITEITETGNV